MSEKAGLEEWEMINRDDWTVMYGYEENELSEISEQIEKVKTKESSKKSLAHINELRKKIEDFFIQLN